MDYRERYRRWMESPVIDKATKDELAAIAHDEKELENRFLRIWNLEPADSVGLSGLVPTG